MFDPAAPPKQYDPDQEPGVSNTELDEHSEQTEAPAQ
jgi:hypothetical protein